MRRRSDRTQGPRPLDYLAGPHKTEVERLRHWLKVYQIELELRSEELQNRVEELQEARSRFFTFFHFAPVGCLALDRQGIIREANLAAASLLGVTQEGLLHQPATSLVHQEDRDRYLDLLAQGFPYGRSLRLLQPEGKCFQAHLHCSRPPEGIQCSHLLTLSSLDHQALHDLNKNERLDSLGALAGGLAHDFNNVLLAAFGNVSLARMSLDDPEALERRLADAESALNRATTLTRQLLTFARGGAPVKGPVPVEALLRSAAACVPSGAPISCRVELAGEVWQVDADQGQLTQALASLVHHAVHSMPEGGSLTLAAENARSRASGARYVRVTVRDTGAGIPEEELPHLFDPYSSKEKGLGLAACHSIVKKHGGKVRVSSHPGLGSTFTLSLPAAAEPPPAEQPEPSARRLCGSGRILVMDDDPSIRAVVQGILRELGYTAEFTANGREAVSLYLKRMEDGRPFDATILDLTVPGGMGGKDALREILKADPRVKAVVSSGYSDDLVLANYRDYGFSAILSKPYLPQEMGRVLSELLRAPGGRPER